MKKSDVNDLINYPVNVSLEEAVELLLIHSKRLETENVLSKAALNRILAENVTAVENIPPFDKSPYDGYAMRSEDTAKASKDCPVTLKIIEEIPAGKYPEQCVTKGCASKILTGAPVPEGADTVIPYEKTVFDEKTVRIFSPMKAGQNVVRKGEDICCGDVAVRPGTKISPAMMAQMAGLGYDKVKVYRRLKAGVLCTGSELAEITAPLTAGKIRNTNGHMIFGYLQEIGAVPEDLGTCCDDAEEIAEALRQGIRENDCIVTTGGASVGDYDVMRDAIALAGGRILFWKVKVKPGSAVVGGLIDGKPVFALSGNPGAASLAMQMLALPVMRRMMGMKDFYPNRIQVKLLEDYVNKSPNRRLLGGKMIIKNGEAYFAASAKQKSGMTSASRECPLIAQIPAGVSVMAGTIIFAYDLEHFSSR